MSSGLTAEAAMRKLEEWVKSVADESSSPVMVGFNAPFDWSFINYYFHRFLGRNPFGFSAIDIKAYYMGVSGSSWHDTRSSVMRKTLNAWRHLKVCAPDNDLADIVRTSAMPRV